MKERIIFLVYIDVINKKNNKKEIRYKCHKCNKLYYDKSTFIKHWRRKHEHKSKCSFCGGGYKNLEKHNKICNKNPLNRNNNKIKQMKMFVGKKKRNRVYLRNYFSTKRIIILSGFNIQTINMDKLTKKIVEIQPGNGIKFLDIPGVFTFKNTQPQKSEPILYQPSMIFITSGSKTISLDSHTYKYGEGKFLLVSIPTSVTCEADTEGKDIFAGIHIDINKNDLYDLIKQMKDSHKPTKKKHNLEPGILSLDISEKIYNAVYRLLECSQDPDEAKVLGPAIIKEIMFYAIQESDAKSFCDLVLNNKNFGPFETMIEDINKNYKSDISIEGLAQNMDMSIPTFYRQFKAITGFSPNQYIKNLRLSKAKNLLINANYSVKQAANEVGYNSQSQFSREYKRYYGYAPVKEGK